jgi:uncharacterized protein (TIGR00369 family)
MNNNDRTYLPTSNSCFVCGSDNPIGLKRRFFVEDEVVKTVFQPEPDHCGFPNVLHGGLVATLLDETMGWAANRAMSRMTLTAEMTVRYLKSVPGDAPVHVHAEITKSHRRMCRTVGRVQSAEGEVFATAEARFLPLPLEETLHIDNHLVYQLGDEKVFERAREEAEAAGD